MQEEKQEIEDDDLPEAMRLLRMSRGLSQITVAFVAGVSTSAYVSLFETRRGAPREADEKLSKWVRRQDVRYE